MSLLMTSRTHDLFAFTFVTLALAYYSPLPQMSMATGATSLGAAFLGGLAPDLDESTAALWQRLPAGSGTILGRVIAPVFGSHRFLSHSIAGVVLFGFLIQKLLSAINTVLVVDMTIVWYAFLLGYISHLAADMLTREGVPLLFPLNVKFGIPPLKALRIKTGGWGEKFLVFPSLILFNGYIISTKYSVFLSFLRSLTR